MKRVILPIRSFIAFIDYMEASQELYVTFRQGKQYVYKIVTKAQWEKILAAGNKANFVVQNIFNNKKISGDYCKLVPAAEIETITMPQTKYYRTNLAR